MGKNAKYEISNPTAPATSRQTYTIYLTTGVDVRECKLTKGQASDTIDMVNSGKAYHARQAMIDMGGVIKRQDVIKNHRNDSKPRTKKAAPKKAKTEGVTLGEAMSKRTGIESLLDASDDEVLAVLKALREAKAKPEPVKKSTRAKVTKPKPKAEKPVAKPITKAEELGLEPVDISSKAVQDILKRFAAVGR